MSLNRLSTLFLPSVENQLCDIIDKAAGENGRAQEMRTMLRYHLGLDDPSADASQRGKRIRPLILLLVTSAAGGDWKTGLPAAASVELIHNFSLIHDDIQDHSQLRRGRPTVWVKWGESQAINAGDAMFTLAQDVLLDLQDHVPAEVVLRASRVLQRACLALTQGQFLDLSYESRNDLDVEDYWPMVNGKTAALLSACTEIGALISETEIEICRAYRRFGRNLGLAFQALDDLLGIWGDAALTGKSTESDLLTGKKSLPVLYAIGENGAFARRWVQGPISVDEVAQLADQLKAEGAHEFTQACALDLTERSLTALEAAKPTGEAGVALRQLAEKLLSRHA